MWSYGSIQSTTCAMSKQNRDINIYNYLSEQNRSKNLNILVMVLFVYTYVCIYVLYIPLSNLMLLSSLTEALTCVYKKRPWRAPRREACIPVSFPNFIIKIAPFVGVWYLAWFWFLIGIVDS